MIVDVRRRAIEQREGGEAGQKVRNAVAMSPEFGVGCGSVGAGREMHIATYSKRREVGCVEQEVDQKKFGAQLLSPVLTMISQIWQKWKIGRRRRLELDF